MADNKNLIPQAKNGLERLKYEVANEVGVPIDQGDNRNLTTAQVGKVGGNMVKKLVAIAEEQIK